MHQYRVHPFRLPLLVLAFVLLPLTAALAGEEIGKVIALRGQVTAQSDDGKVRTLRMASPVLLGDTLHTGKAGRTQLLFKDSTIISLGAASDLVVADYAWDGQTGRMKTVVNEGVFRVLGGSITKSSPKEFTTETPSATIGIRGSMYAGRVRGGALQVVFQGGTGIFVRTPVNQVEIDTVGFGSRVEGEGMAAAEPYRMDPKELDDINPLAVEAAVSADEGADDSATAAAEPATATEDDSENETPADAPAEETAEAPSDDSAAPAETTAEEAPPTDTASTEAPVDEPAVTDGAAAPEPATDAVLATDVPVANDTLAGDTAIAPVIVDMSSLTQDLGQEAATDPLIETPPIDTTPVDTTPPAPTYQATVSGRYMAVQDDLDIMNNTADLVWTGTIAGETNGGQLTGQASTNNGTVPLEVLSVSPYDPSLTYSGASKSINQSRTLNLLGQPTTFSSAVVGSDNTGEFAIFTLNDVFNTPTYTIRELGFAGTPTLTLPTTGINEFGGPLVGMLDSVSSAEFEGFSYSFSLVANWHCSKVFGVIETPGVSPSDPSQVSGFFFGNISGTGITGVKFIGMDIVEPDTATGFMPLTITGSFDFGQFYGNQSQAVGFVASGNTYDVYSQTLSENWQLTAAGYRDGIGTAPSATGTQIWEGFVVGIGDNMDNPDLNRRIFMNNLANDFKLTVNRDTGTIDGLINATDQAGSTVAINGLTVGGSYGSAYVMDGLVAAGLGGSSAVNGGTLRPYGNYLVCEDPEKPIAAYATWGNWELAYEEPGSPATPYHVHSPGSMWVAGERTPTAEVQGLIDTNFTAAYTGRAVGMQISASGSYWEMQNGTTTLNVDFGAQSFNGNLNFTEVNLPVAGSLNSSGLAGYVTSAPVSSVQGAFYGPSAASVAGSFDAKMSTGERYLGIFGGDR